MDDLIQDGNSHHYVGGEGDGGETVLFRVDLRWAMASLAHIAQVVRRANEWRDEEYASIVSPKTFRPREYLGPNMMVVNLAETSSQRLERGP